jgi:hypothetical protein
MLLQADAIDYKAVRHLPDSLAIELAQGDGLLRSLSVRYLETLVRVAAGKWALSQVEIDALREYGAEAARQGVGVAELVKVCSSGARQLWPRLSGECNTRLDQVANRAHVTEMAADVLQVADVSLSAVIAGHAEASRLAIAGEHAAREEFLADLLSGTAEVSSLVERAERIGLQLAASHFAVAVETNTGSGEVARQLQSALHGLRAWSSPLVRHRGLLVAIVAAAPCSPNAVKEALSRVAPDKTAAGPPCWRAGIGRTRRGLRGIQISYADAREAVELAGRLGTAEHVVSLDHLLLYRTLTRDRGAIADLIRAVLEPLTLSRHGARPLLDTLDAYFAVGCVTTQAAQLLHLSVRAVSYRLARIQRLTGYDVDIPTERLALHVSVLGARMLGWPAEPLPDSD